MTKFDPVLAEWASVAGDQSSTLVQKSLKMAQLLEYPDLDVSEYVKKLDNLCEGFGMCTDSSASSKEKLKALGSYMFGTCEFRPNYEDHYDPRNSFLNCVIDNRSGIAITISIIYAEIGRGAGLDLGLVSFPGRVLVRYGSLIIDPLAGGKALERDDMQDLLEATGLQRSELDPAMLVLASPERLLVRMARNLKHSYMHSYAHQKALQCAQIALSMARDSPEDVRDAGLMRARLQDRHGALEDLNRYLEINPNGEDVDHIIDMIHQIRSNV